MTSDPIVTTYNHAGEAESKALPGGRTLGYSHNAAGQLSGVTSNGAPVASIKHVGGRRASATLGGGAVEAETFYDTDEFGPRPAGTKHTSGATTLDERSNTWDANYNRTGRSVTAGPAALQTSHTYGYDGLDRMEESNDGGAPYTYTLDPAGNRTATSDGAYGFNGTGMLLHQYATGPGSAAFGYDAAGRLASLSADGGRSYVYDALGRLKEVRLTAGTSLSAMNELPAGAAPESGTWALTDDGTGNKYLEDTGATAGRILWPPPAGMQVFSFTYWTGHDPADPDGDSDTSEDDPDHFDPKYYAQVMLRATQYEAPDPKEGEWRFLALVIQPDGLYLREFDGEEVEELGKAEVAIPHGQWHTVTIEFDGPQGGSQYDGDSVVVKQLLNGAEAAERIEATTSIPGGGNVGFGVGSDANFRFDNVGTRQDVTLTATAALRYHYDANGRVVGRTLNPGEVDEESQFFIYDGDRIIQELNGEGHLVAAWDYGVYIDEVLQRELDLDNNGTPELRHYYLHDDLYNVVGVTDDTGALVERYEYGDYGQPSIFQVPPSGPEIALGDISAIANRYMFNGREYDSGTGLYYYRLRYMDPFVGRFITPDPIGNWGDAGNLGNPYTYVGNNPWTFSDPLGLEQGPFSPEWHHVFPREVFGDIFSDLDDAWNGFWLPHIFHNSEGTGLHNTMKGFGPDWNKEWGIRIKNYEKSFGSGWATDRQWLLNTAEEMKKITRFAPAFAVGEPATVPYLPFKERSIEGNEWFRNEATTCAPKMYERAKDLGMLEKRGILKAIKAAGKRGAAALGLGLFIGLSDIDEYGAQGAMMRGTPGLELYYLSKDGAWWFGDRVAGGSLIPGYAGDISDNWMSGGQPLKRYFPETGSAPHTRLTGLNN